MSEVVLFLHIPKSGGSTLKSCIVKCVHKGLVERLPEDPRIAKFLREEVYFYPIGFFKDPGKQPDYVQRVLSLPGWEAVIGHFSFGVHRYIPGPSTYVTLLRDPVERVVSLYYHLTAEGHWRRDIELEEFVRDCPPQGWIAKLAEWHPLPPPFSEQAIRMASRTIVDNDQTRRLAGVEPAFGACTTDTLRQAVDNLKHFAVVGLVEHFDESLLMMIRHFNWDPQIRYLPRLINRSKPQGETVSQAVRNLIRERNAIDCELYQQARRLYEHALERQGPDFEAQLAEFREQNRLYRSVNEETVREWAITSVIQETRETG